MADLLVDTNILVLHIVGGWGRSAIPKHRRTRGFTPEDYDLLQFHLRQFDHLKTTPGVLAELQPPPAFRNAVGS
jgi:hypothetical protein